MEEIKWELESLKEAYRRFGNESQERKRTKFYFLRKDIKEALEVLIELSPEKKYYLVKNDGKKDITERGYIKSIEIYRKYLTGSLPKAKALEELAKFYVTHGMLYPADYDEFFGFLRYLDHLMASDSDFARSEKLIREIELVL